LTGSSVCQPVPEVARIEDLFMMQRHCRVYKDGTIRLFKQTYEIIDPPSSNRVTVCYTPCDLSCVYYGSFLKPTCRPNFHQIEERADAHMCISVLA
jgi:hypothetical protein